MLYPTFLVQTSLFVQPHKQKCNVLMFAVARQPSQLDTVHMNFFPTMPETVASQNIDISSWMSLLFAAYLSVILAFYQY